MRAQALVYQKTYTSSLGIPLYCDLELNQRPGTKRWVGVRVGVRVRVRV